MTWDYIPSSEYKEDLKKITKAMENRYFGSPTAMELVLGSPTWAAFCEKNRLSIAEATIVVMGLVIMNRNVGNIYYHGLDEWVEKFKDVVADYIKDENGFEEILKTIKK